MIDFLDSGHVVMAVVLGLLIGSFLNVVVYRLPKMMEQQWDRECAEHMAVQAGKAYTPSPPELTLSKPRSRCPHCGHQVRWFENIPVISWIFLRAKCASCSKPISIRYPLVEVATGVLFGWCIHQWGVTPTGVAWCFFSAALLTLALIDWDTTYLPDDLTLPLLWAGLIAAALGWTAVSVTDAIWGAVGGYLSLWSVYWLFKLVTGKEGMGYGDFKLFAALGVWFGWQALLPIILISSIIGAIVGIGMKFTAGLREGGYIPFGPFLAGAGFLVMLCGEQLIMRTLLGALGL